MSAQDQLPGREADWPEGIAVLVVDTELALAQALAAALVHEPSLVRVRPAADPREATQLLEAEAVDVVVAGTDRSEWDPFDLVRTVRRRWPEVPVVAISGDDDPARVTEAVRAGAVSWAPKQVSVQELASILVGVSQGRASMPPAMLLQVLRRLAASPRSNESHSALASLTSRERQILDFTAHGMSRREIAAQLNVSVNTIRTHVQHVLSKLGVHTTLEAVSLALREQARDETASALSPLR